MCLVTKTTAADCQYDSSPCTCFFNEGPKEYSITCDNIPMADVATAFQSKPALDIHRLTLGIRPEGDSIPADLLGKSRITFYLAISLAEKGSTPVITIDTDASRSSKNSLQYVSLGDSRDGGLDTSQMDLDFLADFTSVSTMLFNKVLNLKMSLPTLPFLPSLTGLQLINRFSDINEAFTESVLKCNGLKYVTFQLGGKSYYE